MLRLPVVAAGWPTIALVLDVLLGVYHPDEFKFYTAADFWVDARFCLGWALGLLVAPSLYDAAADTDAAEARSD